MDATLNYPDGLSLQVMRLVADARDQLVEMRRLLVVNAEVLEECRRLILAYHPESALALAALGEEVAAHVADFGSTLPTV